MDGFLQRKIREQNKYDLTQRHLWCWQPAVPEVMKLLVVFSEQPGWRGRKLHIHLAEAAEGARQAAKTGLGQMSWWRNECKRGASKPVSKCGAHLVPFTCRRGWGVGHAIPNLQITATHEPIESFQQNAETDQKGNLIYIWLKKLETRKKHDRACQPNACNASYTCPKLYMSPCTPVTWASHNRQFVRWHIVEYRWV